MTTSRARGGTSGPFPGQSLPGSFGIATLLRLHKRLVLLLLGQTWKPRQEEAASCSHGWRPGCEPGQRGPLHSKNCLGTQTLFPSPRKLAALSDGRIRFRLAWHFRPHITSLPRPFPAPAQPPPPDPLQPAPSLREDSLFWASNAWPLFPGLGLGCPPSCLLIQTSPSSCF